MNRLIIWRLEYLHSLVLHRKQYGCVGKGDESDLSRQPVVKMIAIIKT